MTRTYVDEEYDNMMFISHLVDLSNEDRDIYTEAINQLKSGEKEITWLNSEIDSYDVKIKKLNKFFRPMKKDIDAFYKKHKYSDIENYKRLLEFYKLGSKNYKKMRREVRRGDIDYTLYKIQEKKDAAIESANDLKQEYKDRQLYILNN